MRKRILILCSILLASVAFAGPTSLQFTRSDDESFAKWERNGVRYITYDAGVLAAIDKLLERKYDASIHHANLGNKYAELGRAHGALAREQPSVSRDRKRKALEQRRRELDQLRQQLERRQTESAKAVDDALDALFERAVREGKARRR